MRRRNEEIRMVPAFNSIWIRDMEIGILGIPLSIYDVSFDIIRWHYSYVLRSCFYCGHYLLSN